MVYTKKPRIKGGVKVNNILLVCSAGMSTSMVVKNMQKVASERGMDVNIWAVGDAESREESKKADIILLGPQVRYIEDKMKDMVNHEKPVAVIDMMAYGTMNGEKVLDDAIATYEAFEK